MVIEIKDRTGDRIEVKPALTVRGRVLLTVEEKGMSFSPGDKTAIAILDRAGVEELTNALFTALAQSEQE